MIAPDQLEAMKAEFDAIQKAGGDLASGGTISVTYGLLLASEVEAQQKQLATQAQQLADLKAKLQQAVINLLAIGGMYWDNLPKLPEPIRVEP